MEKAELSRRLITSIIKADATENTVKDFINREKGELFGGIAVDLPYLDLAKELLQGTGTRLIALASYPLGGMTTATKIRQLEYAIANGADEINVSMNYSAIKSGDLERVAAEIETVAEMAAQKIEVLMIPQTHILTNEEKIEVCRVILEGGINGIKLNSGLGWNTRPEDVILLRREFGSEFRIDVSGGVRTLGQVEEYLELGADYIHTSTPGQVLGNAQ